MKMSNVEKVDYVDALIANAEAAESGLGALNKEEAEEINQMHFAVSALREWDASEPVTVSEDFWPKLRDKLPEHPQRNPLRSLGSRLAAWLWPAHSPLALSMRVGAIAIILALSSFWFAPQQAVNPTVAGNQITAEEEAFIERSMERHEDYVSSHPPGDMSNGDSHQTEANSEYVPR